MDPVLIFLAVAILIIAVAFFVTWIVRRSSRKKAKDLNTDPRDGDAIATWTGIKELDDH